jgi:ribosomal 30S subunit maturation factor RimM
MKNELPDDEMPVQLLESISNEADKVTEEKANGRVTAYKYGYRDGYFIGATAYAPWLLRYDESQKEVDQLRRWKMEAAELLAKVHSYAHKHLEVKLGQCNVEFTIAQAKERDSLKARCEKMEAAIGKVIGRIAHINDTITNDVVVILNKSLAWTDGHNTESVTYIPGKGATLHERIEKEGEA